MLFHDCYVVGKMLNSEPTCIIIGVLLDIIKKKKGLLNHISMMSQKATRNRILQTSTRNRTSPFSPCLLYHFHKANEILQLCRRVCGAAVKLLTFEK